MNVLLLVDGSANSGHERIAPGHLVYDEYRPGRRQGLPHRRLGEGPHQVHRHCPGSYAPLREDPGGLLNPGRIESRSDEDHRGIPNPLSANEIYRAGRPIRNRTEGFAGELHDSVGVGLEVRAPALRPEHVVDHPPIGQTDEREVPRKRGCE